MTAQIRIAFDMTFPNRNPAGSGVYATELLGELRRRADIAIATAGAREGGGFPVTMNWLMNGARRAMAGAQLVHCPAFVAPWRLGLPLVLTVHDTSTQKFPKDHSLKWRAYTRLFLAGRARAAVCVITGTEYSRREIVRDLGVPAERVAVTPYGVAERFFGPSVPRTTAGKPPLLLFPGAPTRRKNLELVLMAMSSAPVGSRLGQARLAISGAEADRFPHHRDRINALGLASRVDWRGKVPAASMPDLIGTADLVLYPSLHEGFGFPALEAMAAGTPVVASNAACLPEVLGDGALLVDPSDVRAFTNAVEAVSGNEAMRRDLVEKGKARAGQFTWRRCADLTVEVYREAVAARKHLIVGADQAARGHS
ncbi:MAG: glycosyltransferase family 4 protein [Candidatus Dormibacteraeota bacterium]|nr:glycosyltransferase family 4 protein [Candidatus Dormibacteraeota bacterium]